MSLVDRCYTYLCQIYKRLTGCNSAGYNFSVFRVDYEYHDTEVEISNYIMV